jgi:hypothetical protein
MCMVLLYMNNDKIGNVRACQKCTEVHFLFYVHAHCIEICR